MFVNLNFSIEISKPTSVPQLCITTATPFSAGEQLSNDAFPETSFGEFKSGDEFMVDIEKDEAENHNQFDLSVNPNELDKNNKMKTGSGDDSSKNSSGDSGEKWWNQANVLQESKLEVTNCSINQNRSSMDANNTLAANKSSLLPVYTNNATTSNTNNNNKRQLKQPNTADQSPTKKHRHKVDVSDYFGGKSEMPNLANRDAEELKQIKKYNNQAWVMKKKSS